MHFALPQCKRLLHYDADYALWMDTPNARLRKAREAAGFDTAVDAADALGVPRSTYIGHENGHRGFPAKKAPLYARRFKVSEEWLLYGKGDQAASDADPIPSAEVLAQMVQEAIDAEVTVETRLSDLPRVLGSNLRAQLEQFATDPGVVDFWAEKLARDKGAQSRAPTSRDAEEESRTA